MKITVILFKDKGAGDINSILTQSHNLGEKIVFVAKPDQQSALDLENAIAGAHGGIGNDVLVIDDTKLSEFGSFESFYGNAQSNIFEFLRDSNIVSTFKDAIAHWNKIDNAEIERIFKSGLSSQKIAKSNISLFDIYAYIAKIVDAGKVGKSKVVRHVPMPEDTEIETPTVGTENVDWISLPTAIKMLQTDAGKNTHAYIVNEVSTSNAYLMFWKPSVVNTYLTSLLNNPSMFAPITGTAKAINNNVYWTDFKSMLPKDLKVFEMSHDGGFYLIRIAHNDLPTETMRFNNVTPNSIIDEKFGFFGSVDDTTRGISYSMIPFAASINELFTDLLGDKAAISNKNIRAQVGNFSERVDIPSSLTIIDVNDDVNQRRFLNYATIAYLNERGFDVSDKSMTEVLRFLNTLMIKDFKEGNTTKMGDNLVLFTVK